jgi:DNA polymerase-3 subunit alpha
MPAKAGGRSERGIANKAQTAAFEKRQREHVDFIPLSVRAQNRQAAASHRLLKPMRFVSLHHHSTYSFLDGYQLPEAHVRRATEINMQALAMTEHGNIFSHVKLEKAAMEQGVKPIFGCEFYCGWTDEERRSQKKNHLTVIAKDKVGYENLLALTTKSWREGFYYEPTVDWDWLVQYQKGLIVLSGCQGSALFTAAVGGKHVAPEEAGPERALRVARWFSDRLDDFYIEVQAFPELESTRRANPILAAIGERIGRPLVATMDVHYTAPEEAEIQKILHNVRPGEQRTLEEMERDWGYTVPLAHPTTDMAVYRRLRATGLTQEQAVEAIVSTEEIAQECNVTLPKLPRTRFPLPEGFDDVTEYWRHLLKEGWEYRRIRDLPAEEIARYKAQLAKEMEVIEAKEYENYFLIVADSIVFAKEEQIPVGPARGSAAASLCCYLLRITEVNPMLFDNLVFERFIDWSREDMPDIDMDFATYGRPRIREYLVEKYGDDCVSNIGTFTTYKAKNSLDDAARVHRVPFDAVNAIKNVLIERSGGDLRASATIEDTVDQFDAAYEALKDNPDLIYAMDLEGNVKGHSVHAAGLVVSSEPITNVTALLEKEVPKGSGNIVQVVAMDKYDAERQGLEKLDYLALGTMDMIAEALKQLDMTLEELYAIPLTDEETIQGFRENDVVGVFQFDGRATRIVNGALKPDDFHEIVCVNALSRPGPLHNGAVQGYVNAKFHNAENDRIHPALDAITEDTQYQIIFQEQILRIVSIIGGFDWTSAAYIRKIISKKLGEQEFNRQWEDFRKGAMTVHERMDVPPMSEEVAKQIWGMCITAGAYAFNAAHSTAYSMIAFWTMWLKRHYPAAFFAASLAKTRKESGSGSAGERGGSSGNMSGVGLNRHTYLIRDAVKGMGKREPITVLPPCLDSSPSWRVERVPHLEGRAAVAESKIIRAGFEQIHGIGAKMAQKIAANTPFEKWEDLLDVPGIGPKKIETIVRFAEAKDPFGIYWLDEAIRKVKGELEDGMEDASGRSLPVPTHTADEIFDAPGNSRITFLGQPIHANLRDLFESNRAKTGEALDPSSVKDAHLSQWVVLAVRDSDDLASFVVSRRNYPRFKEMVWNMSLESDDLVLLSGKKGKMKGTLGERSGIVFVDKMWVLSP